MGGENNSAGGRPFVCQRCLAMTRDERRLLTRIAKRDPEFARHFLQTLMRPEPGQATPQPQAQPSAQQGKPGASEEKPETSGSAAQSKKPTLLEKIGDEATRNLLLKLKKAGVGAAGIAILYQAVDNLEDWVSGRDAASSAYGVITDNFGGAADALSSPLVGLGAALGIGIFWGRNAWRRLKKAWKAAAQSAGNKITLANERLTERVRAAAEFIRSLSKTAFVALSCYHAHDLTEAGRKILEVDPNSDALGQAQQLLNQFFSAAPATLVPVFAYMLAKATEWLMAHSVRGFLEPVNEKKREKLLEEQRRPRAGEAASGTRPNPPHGPA